MGYYVVLAFAIVLSGEFQYGYGEECNKSSNHPQSRIKDSVLCDYDASIRPVVNHMNATEITIGMVLKSLEYDMHSSAISVHVWLTLTWQDDHLTWNTKDYDDMDRIYLHDSEFWTPDISIYNAYDQSAELSLLNGVTCSISNTGEVNCVPPVKLEGYCKAKLRRYPFDIQNCTITFGSWIYTGEEVNFKFANSPVGDYDYMTNSEWKMINITTYKDIGHYKCCAGSTYPSVRYTFTIERYPGFQAATILAPAFAMVIMTMMVLCLNPASMDRLCLACCNLISHMLHLQFIAWQLPNFGDEIPLLILFGRDSLILATFALLLTIVLKRIVQVPEDSPMWISDTITKLLSNRAGQIILLFDSSLKGVASRKGDEDGANIIENNENNKPRDCIIFANILDRLCFVIFFITYFCMFIQFICAL